MPKRIENRDADASSSPLTKAISYTLIPPPVESSIGLVPSPSPILHTASEQSAYDIKRRKFKENYDTALEQLEVSHQNSLDQILSDILQNFKTLQRVVELCQMKTTKKDQIEKIEERLAVLNSQFQPGIDLLNIQGQFINGCETITSQMIYDAEKLNVVKSSFNELLRFIPSYLEPIKEEIRRLTNRKQDLMVEFDALDSQYKLAYLEHVDVPYSHHKIQCEAKKLQTIIKFTELYTAEIASLRDEYEVNIAPTGQAQTNPRA